MMTPPIPGDEAERVAVLEASRLLDSAPDPFLDALVIVMARSFRVPTCVITLVDRDRQWFKAKEGIASCETPRSCSFCAHTFWWPKPLVVLDALEDERFCDNPLVLGEPRIRFYAGVPLVLDGFCIGALCLIDHRAHARFDGESVRILAGAATAVEERLRAIVHKEQPPTRSRSL